MAEDFLVANQLMLPICVAFPTHLTRFPVSTPTAPRILVQTRPKYIDLHFAEEETASSNDGEKMETKRLELVSIRYRLVRDGPAYLVISRPTSRLGPDNNPPKFIDIIRVTMASPPHGSQSYANTRRRVVSGRDDARRSLAPAVHLSKYQVVLWYGHETD